MLQEFDVVCEFILKELVAYIYEHAMVAVVRIKGSLWVTITLHTHRGGTLIDPVQQTVNPKAASGLWRHESS